MNLAITNGTSMYTRNAVSVIDNARALEKREKTSESIRNNEDLMMATQFTAELAENAVVSYNSTARTNALTRSISLSVSDGRALQIKLANMGFYNAAYDGNVTSSSFTKALENFERVFCEEVTGELTTDLKEKIEKTNAAYTECLNSNGMSTIANELDLSATHKKNAALTWVFLREGMGLTKMHASAVMGNIFAESAFSCTNAQDSYGYTGEDNYSYEFSTNDGVGYGLMQWTYFSRKEGLQEMADAMGRDESNLAVQLAHIKNEVTNEEYKDEWKIFKTKTTIASATNYFLDEIEKAGKKNYQQRQEYAIVFYDNLV